jgi:DNA (cytosine-5)-methyltransferase 1
MFSEGAARPRLLDLFCGAGGAAMGYYRAGFEVVGVDIKPQPHYPFEFHQGDALTWPLEGFDAIHASPPCQFWTQMAASWRNQGFDGGHVDLLTPTLELLRPLNLPWVVENVVGARRGMRASLMLHGGMFGLRVHRPRLFESNILMLAPMAPVTREPVGVYDTRPRGLTHHRTRSDRNGKKSEMRIARTLEEAQEAMGMDWADWHGTKEAIPPAYTEWIGHQLIARLGQKTAVPAPSSGEEKG